MERSHFAAVKDAFAADLDTSLNALGVEIVKGGNAEWKSICCPVCTDSGGSARIARATGFLACMQCARRLDLFEWWREVHGSKDDWEACHQIGERLGIKYVKPTGKRKKGSACRMTPKILDQAIHDLIESPEAEWARKHFKERGLWDVKILSRFGVGFLDGAIIFAQFDRDGSIRERYRIYTPNAKVKWHWSKLGTGGPTGFWPAVPEIPDGAAVLLCEGEMDCLAAWIKLELHKRKVPIVAFTWTGGAASPLASSLMPTTWPKRLVYVCYDNDVFQGPDVDTYRAPNQKKLREMTRRRSAMLKGVVAKLLANKCKVILLHVDIDPVDNFGSDLRDWATAGKTFDDLPQCGSDELIDHQEKPLEVSHAEAFESAGEFVHFQGSVTEIEQHSLAVPLFSKIICPMGSKPCCRDCPVIRTFTDQEIDWSEHRGHLLNSLLARDPESYIIRKMIGKPAACAECSIEHQETTVGSWWKAGADDATCADGMKMIEIISTEEPSLSGSIGITGWAHYTAKSVGVFATSLEQLDKPEANLETYHHDLMGATPWSSNDEAAIDRYVESMVQDYSHNITKIYGRPELHLGTMLVAHSCLWYELEGHRYRAWLDACFFGETRKGKSETIKRLFDYWRLGTAFTCMENFSRAGLTVGGAENGSKMRPGLFPKNNRKMLFLDEFHHMTGGPADKNVMVHLQSARDEGKVSALKVYGDLKLPAASRLITAGNWAGRNRRTFQFFCQHLLAFYGVPESLSRMDWAWCIHGDVKMVPEDVEHFWTPEFSRALILRAWAMDPHQIHFDEDVVDYAKRVALEWDEIYAADDLPLHTGIEKYHSIIRTAIAIANICYSHPDGNEADCQVRLVHVKWAIAWIIKCWHNLQYDEFSQRRIAARTLTQPFHVERLLTVELDLSDPDHGAVILSRLTEANAPRSLQGFIMGNGNIEEPRHYAKWLAGLMRYGAIVEKSENRHHIFYVPTEGCLKILHGLVKLARDDMDAYSERYDRWAKWSTDPGSMSTLPGIAADPDIDTFEDDDQYLDDDCPF